MRIAALILGLLFFAGAYYAAIVWNAAPESLAFGKSSETRPIGLVIGALWLVSCGLVMRFPRDAMVLFVVTAAVAYGAAFTYRNLAGWGTFALIWAVLSYFGWREQRREHAGQ